MAAENTNCFTRHYRPSGLTLVLTLASSAPILQGLAVFRLYPAFHNQDQQAIQSRVFMAHPDLHITHGETERVEMAECSIVDG